MRRIELEKAFTPIPDDCYHALMSAAHSVEEETVVKRKVSVAFVFAMILVLAVGVALAVISMRDTGRQVLFTEQTDGYYQDWPIEKKVSLVNALVELGYAEETEEVKQLIAGSLTADDAARVADKVLVAFTGMEVSEISFMEIMQAAWGPFTQWTKEEQAWYSQLMVEMGLQGEDHTLYVEPEGAVDEAQAIAIARREIARGFGVEEVALGSYLVTTSFQVPEFVEPGDTQPYWYVEFMAPEGMPKAEQIFGTFWVFAHPETGGLLYPIEEQVSSFRAYWNEQAAIESDPLMQEMRRFGDTYDPNPARTSLEAKALWSQQFRQRVLEKEAQNPGYFSIIEVAMASFEYGMPDDKAIPQEKAFEIAKAALVEKAGRIEEEVYFFTHRVDCFYDITNPQKPLWKFFFHMPNEWDSDEAYGKKVLEYYGQDGERLPNIKVEIDAYTEELHRVFTIDFADISSAEEYKEVL